MSPDSGPQNSDYRQRIYASYASLFQGNTTFDSKAAERWGRAFDFHFNGLMPAQKDAAILDVACGNGWMLHFFKKRGYSNLRGVDISAEQVALSRQVVPDVACANAMEYLLQHGNEFDLITAVDVIEHLPKEQILPFLDACHSALRKNGRLILQTPNADSPAVGGIRYGDFTHESCFNANSLGHLMRLTGLREVKAREMGPAWGYSLISSLRRILWKIVRVKWEFFNLIETGFKGSGIYTRVFLISGQKP